MESGSRRSAGSIFEWATLMWVAVAASCSAPEGCEKDSRWGTFSALAKGPGTSENGERLTRDFVFTEPDGTQWTAPEWTADLPWEWNGASVPRVFQRVFGLPKDGCHKEASVIHDFQYQSGGVGVANRAESDRIYYRACRAGGLDAVRAKLEYAAIRMFGAIFFGQGAPQPLASTREQLVALYRVRLALDDDPGPDDSPTNAAFDFLQDEQPMNKNRIQVRRDAERETRDPTVGLSDQNLIDFIRR